MAISLADLKVSDGLSCPRIIVYGVNGIGKTTFGTKAPNPAFVLTEKGLGKIKGVVHFPLCRSYAQFEEQINFYSHEDHDRQTLVIDSLDWLEKLVFDHIARDANKDSISDIGYGKGYDKARDEFYNITQRLDYLNEVRNMAIILIGHAAIKTYHSPDTDNYDRYRLDMNDKTAEVVQDWCDALLFANYKTYIKQVDGGFNKIESKGIGSGERVMYTEERPAFWAKNRYNLPYEMPFSWDSFISEMGKSLTTEGK